MRDLVFVAIALAFFGLCYLYVLGCDRIIKRETATPASREESDRDLTVADPTHAGVKA
jgi:hypothetical protein